MIRTDMDTGHRTLDAGPQAPYYKLTGELQVFTVISGSYGGHR